MKELCKYSFVFQKFFWILAILLLQEKLLEAKKNRKGKLESQVKVGSVFVQWNKWLVQIYTTIVHIFYHWSKSFKYSLVIFRNKNRCYLSEDEMMNSNWCINLFIRECYALRILHVIEKVNVNIFNPLAWILKNSSTGFFKYLKNI